MPCQHNQPVFTPTPELTHHGKETCMLCGRFIRWVPKPETVERQNRNACRLVALRDMAGLTDWEKTFVRSLDESGPKFSPKQQEWLDKIAEKYGA